MKLCHHKRSPKKTMKTKRFNWSFSQMRHDFDCLWVRIYILMHIFCCICVFHSYLQSPCRCKIPVFQCDILATSFQSKCRKHLKYFTHLRVDSTTFPKVNECVKSFLSSASDEHYSIDVPFRFDRFTLRFCDFASFTFYLCVRSKIIGV